MARVVNSANRAEVNKKTTRKRFRLRVALLVQALELGEPCPGAIVTEARQALHPSYTSSFYL